MYPAKICLKSFTQFWYLLWYRRWSAFLISILNWHWRGIFMVGDFSLIATTTMEENNLHMQSWSTFRLLRKLASLWKFGITAGVGLRSGQIITCEGRPHPFPASAPYLVGIDVVFNWPVRPCTWLTSEISHFVALLHDIWIRLLERWYLKSTWKIKKTQNLRFIRGIYIIYNSMVTQSLKNKENDVCIF